jgi:hypothetical protein
MHSCKRQRELLGPAVGWLFLPITQTVTGLLRRCLVRAVAAVGVEVNVFRAEVISLGGKTDRRFHSVNKTVRQQMPHHVNPS